MENQSKSTNKMEENKQKPQREAKCQLFLGNTPYGIKVMEFLDGVPFSIFITLVTLVTLFSDDIRIIFFSQNQDVSFSIVTLICMLIYSSQMIVLSFVKEGYFLRYYFWLDLISTVSMLLDLVWINALINGNGIETASKVVKLAKVSRVSKIGAKSTRLIRILRLIRVLRHYRTAKNQLNKENDKKITIQENQRRISDNMMAVENCLKKTHNTIIKVDKGKNGSFIFNKNASKYTRNLVGPYFDEINNNNKLQVSLKNIVFQGSQRKLSVLHPSQKKSIKVQNHFRMENSQIRLVNIEERKIKDNRSAEYHGQIYSGSDINLQTKGIGLELQIHKQTRVGKLLKQEIQKNVVSIIFLMLISVPILNSGTWYDNQTSYLHGINQLLFYAGKNSTEFSPVLNYYISEMIQRSQPLVYVLANINETCCQFPAHYLQIVNTKSLDNIRSADINVVVVNIKQTQKTITVAFDQSLTSKLEAQLSIGRTIFICILLIVVTLLFTRDVETQALEPLENMMDTVRKIAINPLQAIKDIQKQKMIQQVIQSKRINPNVTTEQDILMLAKEQKKILTEPVILQNMIIKIGSLLAVGFGEAGTQIIAKNIQNYGSLNVMMPGKKVMCIYGFCDIRNFTDATEVLQADVMVFVNQIAQICHEVVNRVGGNPNKNIGDAFLLVWKFDDDDTVIVQNRYQTELKLRQSLKVKQTADLSVYSFVKMMAQIARSYSLQKYKYNDGLKNRINKYQGVKMGFGLHVGWAIQGPIGSEFKIDASYLGSNVNFAGRLEAATKQYGVPLLISQQLYDLMTVKNKQHLRQVDNVKLMSPETFDPETGEPQPKKVLSTLSLYTVDISINSLLRTLGINAQKKLSVFEKKKAKVFHNQQRDKLLNIMEKKRISGAFWNQDKDIATMREPFSEYFYQQWKRGFETFQKGKWSEAEVFLNKTLVMGLNNQDGPSKSLLQFMQKTKFIAPSGWDGAREFEG